MVEQEPTIKNIKHLFFTYRNGMLADTLRKYGDPHKIIFGLDIPRIAEIARSVSPSVELADALWKDSEVRESRLLATYLFPVEAIDMENALDLISNVRTREEADMLSFRLLKRLPFATELPEILKSRSSTEETSYELCLAALIPHLS